MLIFCKQCKILLSQGKYYDFYIAAHLKILKKYDIIAVVIIIINIIFFIYGKSKGKDVRL